MAMQAVQGKSLLFSKLRWMVCSFENWHIVFFPFFIEFIGVALVNKIIQVKFP